MIIQSIMIFSLGLLVATLISVLIVPLIWARASNIARQKVIETLPLSEFEIRASRDRLRAEHAMKTHQLEARVDQIQQHSARQIIEINRRELQIHELNNQILDLRQELAEKESQNTVLTQNIDRKMPKYIDRANRLMAVLVERERELAALKRHGTAAMNGGGDYNGFYQYRDDIEVMREELGEEIEMQSAPQRTIIENAETIHSENLELISEVSRLKALLMEFEERETQQTGLLRNEMENIALTLMQEQTEQYRSQFHNLPMLTDRQDESQSQMPFDFEFDEKKPVFIEKAAIAAAAKANDAAAGDDIAERDETSLTSRLESLLKSNK